MEDIFGGFSELADTLSRNPNEVDEVSRLGDSFENRKQISDLNDEEDIIENEEIEEELEEELEEEMSE